MRVVLTRPAVLTATLASIASFGAPAALASDSIKARLDSRDSQQLRKPLNVGLTPPSELAYPTWLEGEWKVEQAFAGYELPAKDLISRNELFAEADVPGFKKLSIAMLPDVGKEGVKLTWRWARDASGLVREDRAANLRSAIRGGLGYDAIEDVYYKQDPPGGGKFGGLGSIAGNPNRLTLTFAPGLTKNADRIELFVNSRESEQPRDDLFYTSEALRQVTFSGTSARQANGEYAHFISYRRISPSEVDVVVVTAVYADPLGAERLFVKAGGSKPIIVFSHQLKMSRSAEVGGATAAGA